MNSRVSYWQLAVPLSFGGKPGLLDALKITSIDALRMDGATITYEEAWTLKEDPANPDLVTSVLAPPGSGSKRAQLSGPVFIQAASKKLSEAQTEMGDIEIAAYLMASFYMQLGASKPEHAGVLVIQDTP